MRSKLRVLVSATALATMLLASISTFVRQATAQEEDASWTILRRANDLVWDGVTERLYASIPSSEGVPHGNHILAIDPRTGRIEAAVFAGSEPSLLVISDDGSMIYIALDGTNRVVPFNPRSHVAGEPIRIGGSDARVEDMAVVPGNANAFVIAKNPGPGGSRNQGLFVFVDGVQLPVTAPGPINAITFSDSASVLYGHNSGISPHTTFLTLSVDLSEAGGVNVERGTGDVFRFYQDNIIFDGARVYSNRGQVIDPMNHEPVGEFELPFGTPKFAPDSSVDRTFYLLEDEVRTYDQRTFLLAGTFVLPERLPNGEEFPDGRRAIVRWGRRGLSFLTDQTIHIIETDIVRLRDPVGDDIFSRGDFNADGVLDLSDVVSILNFLFRGGVDVPCVNAGDVDDDGDVIITDAIYLLSHLFLGGSAIVTPAAPDCGEDPTASGATCESGGPCA